MLDDARDKDGEAMTQREPRNKADEIGGYEVPTGASVLLSPFVTHRLPHLCDEDPETFRVEHFGSDAPAVHHYGYFRSVRPAALYRPQPGHAGMQLPPAARVFGRRFRP